MSSISPTSQTFDDWATTQLARDVVSANAMQPNPDFVLWKVEQFTNFDSDKASRGKKICVGTVLAVIAAIAAIILAVIGIAWSMQVLYMSAIAVGAVALMLLGCRCFLQSKQNRLGREVEPQKIQKTMTELTAPFPGLNNAETYPNDELLVRQLVITTLWQEIGQRKDLLKALYAGFQNIPCKERTALDNVIRVVQERQTYEQDSFVHICRTHVATRLTLSQQAKEQLEETLSQKRMTIQTFVKQRWTAELRQLKVQGDPKINP